MLVLLLAACSGPTPPELGMPLAVGVLDDDDFAGCGCIGQRCDLRHLGVDLDAPVGTPVYAVAGGEVVAVGGPEQEDGWGRGNYALFVRHESDRGPFVALYGHVRTRLTVGDAVEAGAVIAEIGVYEELLYDGTIATYPSHLHFGVHPGGSMPYGATGLALDPYCDSGDTRGWVAPIAFLSDRS